MKAWSILGEALKQIGREKDAQQAFEYYRKLRENERSNHKGNITWNKRLVILGLPLVAVGLIFIVFWMFKGSLAKEKMPSSNAESPTEVAAPIPPTTPTDTPWGLYLPTPKAALATRTPTGSTSTPIPSVQSTVPFTSCIPDNPSQTGKVLEIIDGNTIKVFIGEYVYVVRYIGIDVPAYGNVSEPFGPEATFKNVDLVYRKEVTLIPDRSDKDSRGRLLRYVLVEDTFVNYELVEQGFATALDMPPNSSCAERFRQAEQQAIANQAGRWVASSATSSP